MAAPAELVAILADIIRENGAEVLDQRSRLLAALRERALGETRAVHVILTAMDAGVPGRLRELGAPPTEMELGQETAQIVDQFGTSPDHARRAVETWAAALAGPKTGEAVVSSSQPSAARSVTEEAASEPRQPTLVQPADVSSGTMTQPSAAAMTGAGTPSLPRPIPLPLPSAHAVPAAPGQVGPAAHPASAEQPTSVQPLPGAAPSAAPGALPPVRPLPLPGTLPPVQALPPAAGRGPQPHPVAGSASPPGAGGGAAPWLAGWPTWTRPFLFTSRSEVNWPVIAPVAVVAVGVLAAGLYGLASLATGTRPAVGTGAAPSTAGTTAEGFSIATIEDPPRIQGQAIDGDPNTLLFTFGLRFGAESYTYQAAVAFPPGQDAGTGLIKVFKAGQESTTGEVAVARSIESNGYTGFTVSGLLKGRVEKAPSICVAALAGKTSGRLDLANGGGTFCAFGTMAAGLCDGDVRHGCGALVP